MSRNVLINKNVLIDGLAKGEPFHTDSVRVWTLAEQGQIPGFISGISFTSILHCQSGCRRAFTI